MSSRARTRLAGLVDARLALDELRREPAAAVFARGAAAGPAADRTLFRAVLLPLLVSTAEACGGFDWEDGAFDRVYGELERSLFGPAGGTPPRRRSWASRSAARSSWRAASRVRARTTTREPDEPGSLRVRARARRRPS